MNEEEKNVIDDMMNDEKIPEIESESFNAKEIGEMIREYVRKGNISKIIISRGGDVILNLPLSVGIVGGIIGAVAAPWALIVAAIATAGFDCSVSLVKDDGEIIDLSPRILGQKIKSAGANVADEIREAVDDIKDNFGGEDGEPAEDEEIPFDEPENKE